MGLQFLEPFARVTMSCFYRPDITSLTERKGSMSASRHLLAVSLVAVVSLTALAKDYHVVDVVGDSISAGVNPECEGYGWVNMLFGESAGGNAAKTNTIFTLWPGITAWNSAVTGSTASDWASDWAGCLTAVKNHHPDLVVVFIGGNDMMACLENDGVFSSAEQAAYRADLSAIVTRLQSNSPKPDIIMVNYYDLFDGYSANLSGDFAVYQNMSQAAILGNQIIKEVALSNRCYRVDGIYDSFMHHCYGLWMGDTGHLSPGYVQLPGFDIHPVTAGHNNIYDLLYDKMNYLSEYAVPEWWLAQYGLTSDPGDLVLDQDHDGARVWEEYAAGTCPTNSASVFKVSGSPASSPKGFALRWSAVTDRSYSVLWSTNLLEGFQILTSECSGNAYTDTLHQAEARIFYKMTVTPK